MIGKATFSFTRFDRSMSGPFIFDPIYLFRIGGEQRERERKKEIIVCKNIYIYVEPVLLFIFFAGRWPLYSADIELDHNRIYLGAICSHIGIRYYANVPLIERTCIYLYFIQTLTYKIYIIILCASNESYYMSNIS